jgi:hypothetical protein
MSDQPALMVHSCLHGSGLTASDDSVDRYPTEIVVPSRRCRRRQFGKHPSLSMRQFRLRFTPVDLYNRPQGGPQVVSALPIESDGESTATPQYCRACSTVNKSTPKSQGQSTGSRRNESP